jgi:hypothetical protein
MSNKPFNVLFNGGRDAPRRVCIVDAATSTNSSSNISLRGILKHPLQVQWLKDED